jgi:hypothetical protein
MDRPDEVRRRLDLHNINVDFAVARSGGCGFTHLDTGRVCHLPHRHAGPCQFRDQHRAAGLATGALRR